VFAGLYLVLKAGRVKSVSIPVKARKEEAQKAAAFILYLLN
jgi:hypothetical protein